MADDATDEPADEDDADDVLAHPTRRTVYEHVRTTPGVHPSAIAQDLELHPSTVFHHVERLERCGLVDAFRAWGRVHLFVAGRHLPDAYPVLAARRHPVKDALLALLTEDGPATLTEAADRLGYAKSTVKRHADDLHAHDLLTTDGNLSNRFLRPARPHPVHGMPEPE